MTNNLVFFDYVFIGDNIKKPEKLVEKLNKGRTIKEFFLVVFNEETNHLEIMSSRLFLLKYYREKKFMITAIVSSNSDATEYIRCMVDLSYKRFGNFEPLYAVKNILPAEIKDIFNKEADL